MVNLIYKVNSLITYWFTIKSEWRCKTLRMAHWFQKIEKILLALDLKYGYVFCRKYYKLNYVIVSDLSNVCLCYKIVSPNGFYKKKLPTLTYFMCNQKLLTSWHFLEANVGKIWTRFSPQNVTIASVAFKTSH